MSPTLAEPTAHPCRICGGPLATAFQGLVLDHIQADYHRCGQCASLVVPNPTWLAEAYSRSQVPDPDFGALKRSLFVHRALRRMRSWPLGLLRRKGRTLDVGVGRGLLLRLLLDDGHDAWGFDPYPHSVFAEDRITTDLPDGPFSLITAIEVIEHTLDPVPFLQSLRSRLAPDGLLVLSTELFNPEVHGPSWHYLAPEHGQHITMFSPQGLNSAASAAGLTWVDSLAWYGQPFLHLLLPAEAPRPALRLWFLRQRNRSGERRYKRDHRA